MAVSLPCYSPGRLEGLLVAMVAYSHGQKTINAVNEALFAFHSLLEVVGIKLARVGCS